MVGLQWTARDENGCWRISEVDRGSVFDSTNADRDPSDAMNDRSQEEVVDALVP
jgi:hypothetical protein